MADKEGSLKDISDRLEDINSTLKKVFVESKEPTAENTSEKAPSQVISYGRWAFTIGIAIALAIIFLLFAFTFGFFIVISIDAAKALAEAIATILGFFGLIAVYVLTSYDNRLDKLEEKIQGTNDTIKIQGFRTFQRNIKTRKIYATIRIITGLGCLFVSLLLSITTLGSLGVNPQNPTETALLLAFGTTIIASMLLFIGVFAILVMIYSIGKEP